MLKVLALIAFMAIVAVSFLYLQGKRRPDTSGEYVALGSSFAAGIGLGERTPGSPVVCMRTTGGYPSILAGMLGLRLVDMSCSGSTTTHILKGGQVFLGPQLDAVGPATRLVTITSGGNDVGYIGDLMAASGSVGFLGRMFLGKPRPIETRPFNAVTDNLVEIVRQIRKRAPQARVVIVTYPHVLSEGAPCPALGIDPQAAEMSREVGTRLATATRLAAERSGALLVDMGPPSAGHDACSPEPWVNGAAPGHGTAFHPNASGAQGVARVIAAALAQAGWPVAAPREATAPR